MKPPSLDTWDPRLVGVDPLPTFDVEGPVQKGVLDALQHLNDVWLVPSQTTKSRCHMLPEPLAVKNDIVVLACMVDEHRSGLQQVLPPIGSALVDDAWLASITKVLAAVSIWFSTNPWEPQAVPYKSVTTQTL